MEYKYFTAATLALLKVDVDAYMVTIQPSNFYGGSTFYDVTNSIYVFAALVSTQVAVAAPTTQPNLG